MIALTFVQIPSALTHYYKRCLRFLDTFSVHRKVETYFVTC